MMISNTGYYQPVYSDFGISKDSSTEQNIQKSNSDNSNLSSSNSNLNSNSEQNSKKLNPNILTPEEERVVRDLDARDAEVRAHEAAHMAAGAGLTTGATYSYQRGPDNKMYAISGEVGIDTSEGNTAQETLKKAQQIKRAALAPAQPSPADLQVAATATTMEIDAKIEIQKEQREVQEEKNRQNKIDNPYALNRDYTIRTIGVF